MKKILGIIFMLGLGISLTACSSEKVQLKLKEQTLNVEYGKQIDSHVATYLDNDEDILKEVKLSGLPENEVDKDYPAIGEYTLTFAYKDAQSVSVNVNVQDTTPPKFEDIKEKYELNIGDELSPDIFKVTDLSKTSITLEDKNVNYKKTGTYKAMVIAKDEANNETKKDIEIVVKEEKKETASSSSSSHSSSASTNNKSNSSNQSSTSSNTKNSSSSSSSSSSTSSSSSSSSNKTNSSSSSSSKTEEPALTDTYMRTKLGGGVKEYFKDNGIIYASRNYNDIANYFKTHGTWTDDDFGLDGYQSCGYAVDKLIDETDVWYIYVE